MMAGEDGKGFHFAIDTHRLKSFGVSDVRSAEAIAAYDHHDLTCEERLFFKLWGSNLLNSGAFHPGQKIAQLGEHPVSAHVVVLGEVIATDNKRTYQFGPGSVFGLAEGLADLEYRWDAVAKTAVTTKIIPIPRALREVRRLNAGLKGICRLTAMRVLDLSAPPPNLL